MNWKMLAKDKLINLDQVMTVCKTTEPYGAPIVKFGLVDGTYEDAAFACKEERDAFFNLLAISIVKIKK